MGSEMCIRDRVEWFVFSELGGTRLALFAFKWNPEKKLRGQVWSALLARNPGLRRGWRRSRLRFIGPLRFIPVLQYTGGSLGTDFGEVRNRCKLLAGGE